MCSLYECIINDVVVHVLQVIIHLSKQLLHIEINKIEIHRYVLVTDNDLQRSNGKFYVVVTHNKVFV